MYRVTKPKMDSNFILGQVEFSFQIFLGFNKEDKNSALMFVFIS